MERKNYSEGMNQRPLDQPTFEILISNLPPNFKTQKLKSKVKKLFDRNELFKVSILKVQKTIGNIEQEPDESFALLTAPRFYRKKISHWRCLFSNRTLRFDNFETNSKGDCYINRIFLVIGNFDQRSSFEMFSKFGKIKNIFYLDEYGRANRSCVERRKLLVSFKDEVNFHKMSTTLVNHPQVEELSRLIYKDTKINRLMEMRDAEMKEAEAVLKMKKESPQPFNSGQILGLPIHNPQLIPCRRSGNLLCEPEEEEDSIPMEDMRIFDCTNTKKCIIASKTSVSENHHEGNVKLRWGGKKRKNRRKRLTREEKIERRRGNCRGQLKNNLFFGRF